MAAMSDYLENKLLDHTLRNTAYTPPTSVYVALYTTMPSEAGTGGVEVTGGSYARAAATFAAAAAGQCANSATASFSSMPACTVVGAALVDASTAGNLLFLQTFATAKTYSAGENVTVAIGDLVVTLD